MSKNIYLWDEGDNVLSEDDSVSTTVIYSNEPSEYGSLLSQNRSGITSTYHFDADGDSRELTDDAQTVTGSTLYDAWGNILTSTGSAETPFLNAGRFGYMFDAMFELTYVRARWLQQRTARWLTRDPLGIWGQHGSAYTYGQNEPITRIDPSGLLSLVSDPVTLGKCGAYNWKTSWVLGAGETRGFIVQRVCLNTDIQLCPEVKRKPAVKTIQADCANSAGKDGGRCDGGCYWERWEVPGAILLKDVFAFTGFLNQGTSQCTFGSFRKSGEAVFVPSTDINVGKEVPAKQRTLNAKTKRFLDGFGNKIRDACSLMSRCDSADNADVLAFIARYFQDPKITIQFKNIRGEWDCCGDGCPICTERATEAKEQVF